MEPSSTIDDTHSECDTCTLSEPSPDSREIHFFTTPIHQTSGQSSQYVVMNESGEMGTELFESENISMYFEEEYGAMDQSRDEEEAVRTFESTNLNHKNFQEEFKIELEPTPHENQDSSIDSSFSHEDRARLSKISCDSDIKHDSTGGYVDSGFSATSYLTNYFKPPS